LGVLVTNKKIKGAQLKLDKFPWLPIFANSCSSIKLPPPLEPLEEEALAAAKSRHAYIDRPLQLLWRHLTPGKAAQKVVSQFRSNDPTFFINCISRLALFHALFRASPQLLSFVALFGHGRSAKKVASNPFARC